MPQLKTQDMRASSLPEDVVRFVRAMVAPAVDACAVVTVDALGTVTGAMSVHRDERAAAWVRMAAGALVASADPSLRRRLVAGRPFLLDRREPAAGDARLRNALDAVGARSVVCVPLQRPAGLLLVASATPQRWLADDLPMLGALGRTVTALLAGEDARTEMEDLVADIHHDLTSPMQAISLQLELMLSMLPRDDRRASRASLEQVQRTARRMTHLLAELDEYLHGRGHPETSTTTSLAAALDEVRATLAPVAAEHAIKLATDVAEARAAAAIPPRHLFRVLSNLVGNAIKYAGRGTTVRLVAWCDGERVRIVVADHGPGIAKDDCAHLFDRDWLQRSALRKGRGLGLAIVKRLLERHGGAVAVTSEPGAGSRFVVDLPRAPDQGSPHASA